jgi:hypothetical protein
MKTLGLKVMVRCGYCSSLSAAACRISCSSGSASKRRSSSCGGGGVYGCVRLAACGAGVCGQGAQRLAVVAARAHLRLLQVRARAGRGRRAWRRGQRAPWRAGAGDGAWSPAPAHQRARSLQADRGGRALASAGARGGSRGVRPRQVHRCAVRCSAARRRGGRGAHRSVWDYRGPQKGDIKQVRAGAEPYWTVVDVGALLDRGI